MVSFGSLLVALFSTGEHSTRETAATLVSTPNRSTLRLAAATMVEQLLPTERWLVLTAGSRDFRRVGIAKSLTYLR